MEGTYFVRITAKALDILLDPFKAASLIKEPKIANIGMKNFFRCQEAKTHCSIVNDGAYNGLIHIH